tara:strand:+ start:1449 stop:2228 length:780 start_codon:yes stop_codon:yes gene_type:complete
MTIFTTFNDRMYHATGKNLLSSIKTHLPAAGVVIYEELSHREGAKLVDRWNTAISINSLQNFKDVFEANKDVIPKSHGGEADEVVGDKFWNKRWFGWFKKVVMAHHAICVSDMMEQFGGYFIFVDSDIRFKKGFGDTDLRKLMNNKPIGFFKGDRPEIDSGFVAVDTYSLKPRKFYGYFMDLFLSGNFRNHPRWDDIYLMTRLVENCPQEWFHDFAQGKQMSEYTNSNGHSTVNQIIPFSEMSEYIEHDKGIHVRHNIL